MSPRSASSCTSSSSTRPSQSFRASAASRCARSASTRDRYGPLPEPVENLFAIQEAKIKVARLGADYFVFRGGKATVGKLVLGSGELRELRSRIHTAVYTVGSREVTLRSEDPFPEALRLVDAILEARQAA